MLSKEFAKNTIFTICVHIVGSSFFTLNKKEIENLSDEVIRKEVKKFLKNPKKRIV
jgi:hypothetical protein